MRYLSIIVTPLLATLAASLPSTVNQESLQADAQWNSNISISLFAELEELARIVDISYCVGTTGISKPFQCISRCSEFPDFELVDTFNTGPLMSDSCGYIVLDHGKGRFGQREGRIIVAFRGTYSIANTIVDLSTIPQEYVPYPDNPDNSTNPSSPQKSHRRSLWDLLPGFLRRRRGGIRMAAEKKAEAKCTNCTVHTGFWTSWQNTRPYILPHLESLHSKYPSYSLHLVGHSLGGAVAALAGLEFNSLGWKPTITTFGEPRVGNAGLRDYIDAAFELPSEHAGPSWKLPTRGDEKYRRLTHVDDPVPLLPLQEWGYRPHAGEVFISKSSLQPGLSDVRACYGDEDTNCIAGSEVDESWFDSVAAEEAVDIYNSPERPNEHDEEVLELQRRWGIPIPARYKMWQLFFAHRDYFWRLGLCVPGGDPLDWGRDKYRFDDPEGKVEL